jgi:hypothetical protein
MPDGIADTLVSARVGGGRRECRRKSHRCRMADGSGGLGHHFLGDFQEGTTAHLAVTAVVFGGHAAFNDADELAIIFFHGIVQLLFGLVAGGGHDGLMVFHRKDFQHQFVDVGYMDASSASEHPVHSPKCSQTTGGRWAGAANTSATLGTKDDDSPMVAVRPYSTS